MKTIVRAGAHGRQRRWGRGERDGAEEMGQVLMDGVLAEKMGEEKLSGGRWDLVQWPAYTHTHTHTHTHTNTQERDARRPQMLGALTLLSVLLTLLVYHTHRC